MKALPCLLMRGGTSRGLFFRRENLPAGRAALSRTLVAAIGSGHPLNIDGIGGGSAVTTKVAMLSAGASGEIDFFFAQVPVDAGEVDYRPTCGNMLAAVGPAAIEMGLAPASSPETELAIRAVNTGAGFRATVQTPGGHVTYRGETAIDGVPGRAAPIRLTFRDAVGGVTGALLPAQQPTTRIDGVELTLIDCAMPVAIARAADLGLRGDEPREALDADRALFDRIEALRLAAGRAMGLGDVSTSVVPKFAVIAPSRAGGAILARYFMPWRTHPTIAVLGAIAIAAALVTPGTVAEAMAPPVPQQPIVIEHAMGNLEVWLETEPGHDAPTILTASVLRTARLIMRGEILLPD